MLKLIFKFKTISSLRQKRKSPEDGTESLISIYKNDYLEHHAPMEISTNPLKILNLAPIQEISNIGQRVKIALVPFLNEGSLKANHTFEIDLRSLYHIPEIARIAAADLFLKRRNPFRNRIRQMKGKRLTLVPQPPLAEGDSLSLRKFSQEEEEDDRFSSLFGKKKKKKHEKERN